MGDTRNNMGHSLMIVGCLTGMDVRICGPKTALAVGREYVAIAQQAAEHSPARSSRSPTIPGRRSTSVDFIHTDVWVSMGEPKEVWKERDRPAPPLSGEHGSDEGQRQPAGQVHALPAGIPRHERQPLGKQIAESYGLRCGLEVTDDVFESEFNLAFEQAENRMHTIKAILVATLGD